MNRLSLKNNWLKVQDCRKITNRVRRMYRIYSTFKKEYRKMSTHEPVEVQDLRKITHNVRGMYLMYLKLIKRKWEILPDYAQKSPWTLNGWSIKDRFPLSWWLVIHVHLDPTWRQTTYIESHSRNANFLHTKCCVSSWGLLCLLEINVHISNTQQTWHEQSMTFLFSLSST